MTSIKRKLNYTYPKGVKLNIYDYTIQMTSQPWFYIIMGYSMGFFTWYFYAQRLERIYRKHVKELEKDLDRTEDELQSVLVKYGEHEIDYTQNIWVNDTEKPES